MHVLRKYILTVCLLVICTAGCVSKTFSGHRYTKEEIAFLDLPQTTRRDVVSSLGPPLAEIHGPEVMLYTWETENRFSEPTHGYIGDIMDTHPSLEGAKLHNWGLFIAFDQNGCVSAHEIRRLANPDPQNACEKWALSKNR